MKDVADLFWDACSDLGAQSFLDVGTGLNGVVGLHFWDKLPGPKYALDIRSIKALPAGWTAIKMDARCLALRFESKSIDIIQACDFIEHLTKDDGLRMLADFERVARKAVLLFTPIGLVPSPAEHSEPDNPYQKHLSGWAYEELEALGYATGREIDDNMWRNTNIVAWKLLKSP